ncbi:MAG: muconolactone Delta-isomerase family protein [Pseudonocardiaceae bacterium]
MGTDTVAREQAYSYELQHCGKRGHIRRIVGQYSNLSVFDVADNGELHDIALAPDDGEV